MDCDSISGAWAIERSLSHCQLRGAYKLNFVPLQSLVWILPGTYYKTACEMCAVWAEPGDSPSGEGFFLQSYAPIYVPTLQLTVPLRLDSQTKREAC